MKWHRYEPLPAQGVMEAAYVITVMESAIEMDADAGYAMEAAYARPVSAREAVKSWKSTVRIMYTALIVMEAANVHHAAQQLSGVPALYAMAQVSAGYAMARELQNCQDFRCIP